VVEQVKSGQIKVIQQPLWASTSTKNPAYRDVLYVEELIGPNTVNTMPLPTIERFREHGRARLSIENQLSQAKAQLAALMDVGIHYNEVTRQLQEEGVQKFIDSFQKLFARIDNKRKRWSCSAAKAIKVWLASCFLLSPL
jgi:transaldolase